MQLAKVLVWNNGAPLSSSGIPAPLAANPLASPHPCPANGHRAGPCPAPAGRGTMVLALLSLWCEHCWEMLSAFMLFFSELMISVVLHTNILFYLLSQEVDGQIPWYPARGKIESLTDALFQDAYAPWHGHTPAWSLLDVLGQVRWCLLAAEADDAVAWGWGFIALRLQKHQTMWSEAWPSASFSDAFYPVPLQNPVLWFNRKSAISSQHHMIFWWGKSYWVSKHQRRGRVMIFFV